MKKAKEQIAKAKEHAATIGLTSENADAVWTSAKELGTQLWTEANNNKVATAAAIFVGWELTELCDNVETMADASAISAYVDINEYYGS
jgi:hypothetical protein